MRRRSGAVLLLGALTLLAAATPATAAPLELDGLEYVALGDSYSAGFGLVPYSDQPADGCFQAEQNYPHRLAAQLGLDLDDRTCSGAVTANIRDTSQLTITGAGTAPPQSEALSESTDLVTVTIGGNDLGFSTVAQNCVSVDPNGPPIALLLFQNCKAFYNPLPEVDLLIDTLDDTVKPALAETFSLIAAKAPNARVFVVGYPTIAPDFANIPAPQPPGCFTSPVGGGVPPYPANSFPFTQTDTLYLHHIENELDNAIEAAATAQGFTFVPTWDASAAHSACSSEPYIFGITLTDSPVNSTPTVDPDLFVALGALHPNEAGVAFLEAQVTESIRGEFGLGAPGAAAPSPGLAATGVSPWLPVAAALLLLAAGGAVLAGRRSRA